MDKNPFIIDDNYKNLTPKQKRLIKINNTYITVILNNILTRIDYDAHGINDPVFEKKYNKYITQLEISGKIKLMYPDSETGVNTGDLCEKLGYLVKQLSKQHSVPPEPKSNDYTDMNYQKARENYEKALKQYKNAVNSFNRSNLNDIFNYLVNGKFQNYGETKWDNFKQIKEFEKTYKTSSTAAFDIYQNHEDGDVGLDYAKIIDLSVVKGNDGKYTITKGRLSHFNIIASFSAVDRMLEILRGKEFYEHYQKDDKIIDGVSLGE